MTVNSQYKEINPITMTPMYHTWYTDHVMELITLILFPQSCIGIILTLQ